MCAPMPSFTKKKIGAITGPNLSVLDNMRKVTWLLPNTLSLKQMSPKLVSLVLIQWAGHVRKQNRDMYFRYGDTGSSISTNVKNPARNGGATFKFSKSASGSSAAILAALVPSFCNSYSLKLTYGSRLPASWKGFRPSVTELQPKSQGSISRSRPLDLYIYIYIYIETCKFSDAVDVASELACQWESSLGSFLASSCTVAVWKIQDGRHWLLPKMFSGRKRCEIWVWLADCCNKSCRANQYACFEPSFEPWSDKRFLRCQQIGNLFSQ